MFPMNFLMHCRFPGRVSIVSSSSPVPTPLSSKSPSPFVSSMPPNDVWREFSQRCPFFRRSSLLRLVTATRPALLQICHADSPPPPPTPDSILAPGAQTSEANVMDIVLKLFCSRIISLLGRCTGFVKLATTANMNINHCWIYANERWLPLDGVVS